MRIDSKSVKEASNTWNALVTSFLVISHWLAKNIENQSKFLLGEDPWCGGNKEWKLSQGLINALQRKGLFTLKVIQNFEGLNVRWKLDLDLELAPGFIDEWNAFFKPLYSYGFFLLNKEGTLVWTWNEKSSVSSTKVVYESIIVERVPPSMKWQYTYLWKDNFPLKVKCFFWLDLENKFLTQDNLQKQGGYGANICILCFSDAEIVNHLFVECSFTLQIWETINGSLNCSNS